MPPLKTKLQRAKELKNSNARERLIAKQYLQAGPSILNLYNAFTHWYNSVPFLGGLSETGNEYITGEAPSPSMRNPKTIVQAVKRIDKVNAIKATAKEWDAAYDAAIKTGNIEEAQRLRELHFLTKSPNGSMSKGVYMIKNQEPATISQKDYYARTGVDDDFVTLYHGSTDAENLIKNGFDGIEHGLGRTKGEAKGTIFATPYKHVGADYANLYVAEGLSSPEKVGLVKLKVPRGAGTYEGSEVRLIPEHIKGIEMSNDYKKTPYLKWIKSRKTDNSLFNVKSLDPITYDDTGNIIPLSQRDNFNIYDMRYILAPFVAGGVGYELYNNYNQ